MAIERDAKGRLLPGSKLAKKPTIQDEAYAETIADKRKAILAAVTPEMIQEAVADIFNSAMNAEGYAKVQLWQLFFAQTVGPPPKQVAIETTNRSFKQSIDYSKLTSEELALLQSMEAKVQVIDVEASGS